MAEKSGRGGQAKTGECGALGRLLIQAFNHFVLSRRRGKIRVADIVEHANVGRSTFYDHYSGAEEVHLEALAAPFAVLADAAAGRGDVARLAALLEHFWENRQGARETFDQGAHAGKDQPSAC